jgi:hypothetical protein
MNEIKERDMDRNLEGVGDMKSEYTVLVGKPCRKKVTWGTKA